MHLVSSPFSVDFLTKNHDFFSFEEVISIFVIVLSVVSVISRLLEMSRYFYLERLCI